MIRINLIGERKRPVVAGKPKLPSMTADVGQWALLGLIVLGLLVAGTRYYMLSSSLEQKKREVAEAQRTADELAPVIREVENFKTAKAELERKIKVISDLKASQRGPVRIMDAISAALPEALWVDRLDATDNAITLVGRAFNTNAVASFIENLDRVPEFQEPVLKDATQRGSVYNFTVTFNYSYSPPAAEDQAAGGETGG